MCTISEGAGRRQNGGAGYETFVGSFGISRMAEILDDRTGNRDDGILP
jgi:hypothetical protein